MSDRMYGSRYSKVGLIVLVLGTVFQVSGFSVPEWQTVDTPAGVTSMGLWMVCGLGTFGCVYIRGSPGWLIAVQSLETIALVSEVLGLACIGWYLLRGTRLPAIGTAVLGMTAGITALAGAIVYWSQRDTEGDLYYGFAFCVIGALNCTVASIIYIYEAVKRVGYLRLT